MSEHKGTGPHTHLSQPGFDPGEVDAKAVVLYGGIVVVIIIATFVGVTLFYDKFMIGRFKEVVEGAPNTQIRDLHQREDAALSGYTYVDRAKGAVSLPIERGMQLLVSEVAAGKTPYNTKDLPKPVEPPPPAPGAPAAPGAPPAAAAPAPVPVHH